MTRLSLATAALLASTHIASAEFQFSAYGGWQTAPHSLVTVTGTDPQSFTAGWEGRSFEMPPYYGVRATWWMDFAPNWGLSVDFTHAKVYADSETFANDIPTWSRFEFSDGINYLTLNAMYRFQEWNKFEPYVGLGAGISIPHVEVTRPSGTTFEYQVTGAVAEALIGVNYKLSKRYSVFGEYQFNYSANTANIDSNSQLQTNIITNAFAAGLSVHF
ncbi:MAG: outer membrane beta-barrel protein [Pseudomonadota bacterium]